MQLLFCSDWGAGLSFVVALAYLNRFADSGASSRTLLQGRNDLDLKSHEPIRFFTLDVWLGCLVGEILVGFCCGKAQELSVNGSSV